MVLPVIQRFIFALVALGFLSGAASAGQQAPTYFDGLDAMRAGSVEQAYWIWKDLADEGDSSSQYSLALLLETGQDPIKADLPSALKYYQMAADAGVAEAQTNLGLLYAEGRGVNRNPEIAVELWRKSAAAGHAMGLFNLGLAHYQGTGVAKDQAEATALIFEAALLGQREAQFALGQFYRFGLGVTKSEEEALYWYQLAANQEHIQAGQFSEDLRSAGIVGSIEPTAALRPGQPSTIMVNEDAVFDTATQDAPAKVEPVMAAADDTDVAEIDAMPAVDNQAEVEGAAAFTVQEEDLGQQLEEIDVAAQQMAEKVARRNIEDSLPADVEYLTETEAENAFREALVLFQNPDGDRVVNGRRAVMKLFNSAISGNSKAQRSLGELYLLGLDVTRDDGQALYWLRLAEQNGIVDINGFADVLELRGIEAPARPDAAPVFAN